MIETVGLSAGDSRPLPAPAVRRPESAGCAREDSASRSANHRFGRAHVVPRRLHAGADTEPLEKPTENERARLPLHLPRPRCDRFHVRSSRSPEGRPTPFLRHCPPSELHRSIGKNCGRRWADIWLIHANTIRFASAHPVVAKRDEHSVQVGRLIRALMTLPRSRSRPCQARKAFYCQSSFFFPAR